MTSQRHFADRPLLRGARRQAKPLGAYMARVYENEPIWLEKVVGPVERLLYRLAGVTKDERPVGRPTRSAMLLFNVAGILARLRHPAPAGLPAAQPAGLRRAVSPDLSWNTAVSFATNTNWQSYGGETTMSYLTQMLAPRGAELRLRGVGHGRAGRAHSRVRAQDDGDPRELLGRSRPQHALHPPAALASSCAILLVSQGVVQTFDAYDTVALLQATKDADGKAVTDQVIAAGPRRLADRHQAAGHERRRLLQRQLGAPVREPDRRSPTSSRLRRSWSSRRRSVTRSARW